MFDFASALLYSEARAAHRSDAINMTRSQQSLALSTPDAYNPFSGACAATPSIDGCSPSSRVAIASILFKLERRTKTTLALADFKLSRGDLIKLRAGDLGIALDVEGRRETQSDTRDDNLNGTITFIDAITGAVSISNVAAGIADPNPYDGIGAGQFDLWAYDHYHGSAYGYYLEALSIFGRVTGLDPRSLGSKEKAAFDLGITPDVAAALQRIAFETLETDKRK